ncbi:MAG: protein adenylyltransferase SelO family protein, partial [Pseudomonadota bacterium]
NHTDQGGRYAFDQQPAVAHWNLQALAVALTSFIATEDLSAALNTYPARFEKSVFAHLTRKLGLFREMEGDQSLVIDLLSAMKKGEADYSLVFRRLSGISSPKKQALWLDLFNRAGRELAQAWLTSYQARLEKEKDPKRPAKMDAVNPKYVLRNWVAEKAIRALEDEGDVSVLNEVFSLITDPYQEEGNKAYAAPPPPTMANIALSCSS